MKEQDLHIGCTYLLCLEGEQPSTIKDRADLSAAFDYFSTGHLKGIPLTGDVLVNNLGFEKRGFFFYSPDFGKNEWIELSISKGCFGVSYRQESPDGEIYSILPSIVLVTVHQFQILYFSLTGEFLPYKQ